MNADFPKPQAALRCDDLGVIRASGADARAFLQAQLTQDITSLQPGRFRLAGYCSAKGRLLASFFVWLDGPDDVLMVCSADLLAPTLKRLSMFVMRSKCKLSDASSELACWGFTSARDDASAVGNVTAPAEGQTLLRLADAIDGPARWLLVAPREAGVPALLSPAPAINASEWLAMEVNSGVPRITAANSEQFVPQMVNFDLVDGVNFQKGCYPGQEVVARSQYRGTVKRRLFRFSADANVEPGMDVFDAADPLQPAGRVVNAGRGVLLGEVKLAALEGSGLHLGSADGPALQRLAMPYNVLEPS
jgi:tRNA-modifying protein YgfZ